MMKKSKGIINKRARFDYDLKDGLRVGVVLTGGETKALRSNGGQLTGSYVNIKDDELWLIGSTIRSVNPNDKDEQRSRKLLAKKREIAELSRKKEQGLSIVPIRFLTDGRYIKLEIATGKGKKRYDKRQVIKKRDEERNISRSIKSRI